MTPWRYIEEESVDAATGLATDEYLMDRALEKGSALHLYTYRHYSALVGRFQHIQAELDLEACERLGVQYSRRLTGGGAIIMGDDQLGICLAARATDFQWNTIRDLCEQFAQPLVQALAGLGIKAQFRSKNDLEVDNRKIAGLGVYVSPEGALHFHASLLNDLDIRQMLSVLQIPIQKYDDKRKIESVQQRMSSIARECGSKLPMPELRERIRTAYEAHFGVRILDQPLAPEEKSAVETLAGLRYRNPDWIFQRAPQPDMTGMSLRKTGAGLLRTYIGLKGESIKSVLVTGDFMEHGQLFNHIEAQLKWGHLDKAYIEKVVRTAFLQYPGAGAQLREADVVEAIWMAGQRALAATRYTYKGACYYPQV